MENRTTGVQNKSSDNRKRASFHLAMLSHAGPVLLDESLMSSLERFQNVVLGGGEAGKYIAWELARSGQRVAVVEKGLIGGSCPNIACLPSKNVIHSAKVVELVHHAAKFGLRNGPWAVD